MFDIEKWIPFLLAKSHQTAHHLMKEVLEEFKLTPPQFATLAFLWNNDGLNQHELGCLMSVDRTTIGGILDRLERLEYVRRGLDPRDRRSYVLFVTRKGMAVQEGIAHTLSKVKAVINERLTDEEQCQLIQLLNKFRQF